MTSDNRSRHMQVRLREDTADWFDRNFPSHGMKQWFVESCFESLRELVENDIVVAPREWPDLVVKQLGIKGD